MRTFGLTPVTPEQSQRLVHLDSLAGDVIERVLLTLDSWKELTEWGVLGLQQQLAITTGETDQLGAPI
jgi:hypothetical protein